MAPVDVDVLPAVEVPADVAPWAVSDENGCAVMRQTIAGRQLSFLLPRRPLPIDFAGPRATVNVDRALVVLWDSYEDHLKAQVVFSSKPDVLELWFAVDFGGLTALEDDGGVQIVDPDTGELVAWMPAPFLVDNTGARHDSAWVVGDGCLTAALPDLDPVLYVGAVFDPTTVTTSPASQASYYQNQRKIDRFANGTVVEMHGNGATSLVFYYSADNGTTWTSMGSDLADGTFSASLFIDQDDYVHLAYRSGDGNIYYRRGTPNAGRTAITWSAALKISGDTDGECPDLVAVRSPRASNSGGWDVNIAYSYLLSGSLSVRLHGVQVAANGTLTDEGEIILSNGGASYTGASQHTYPSIDLQHTGDGKSPVTNPALYVAWSAGATGSGRGIRLRVGTISSGSGWWGWSTEREISPTYYVAGITYGLCCLFDGTAVIIGGTVSDGTTATLVLFERDASDTTTTSRVTSTSQGYLDVSMSYDSVRNVYFVGKTSSTQVGYAKWTRSTTTLGAAVATDTLPASAVDPHVSMKRGYSGNRLGWVYTSGAASPYNIRFDGLTLNTAPNAPVLGARANYDATASAAFPWTFSDPDPGDSQSAYQLVIEDTANPGVSVVDTGKVVSTTSSRTVAGGTLTNGKQYRWKVRTWDSSDVVGPYSGWATFYTSAAPTATITFPVNDGDVYGQASLTVTWNYSDAESGAQSAWQVKLLDNAGTTVLWTSTKTSGAATSKTIGYTLANSTSYKVRVTVWDDKDVASTPVVRSFSVSYTPPSTPTLAVTPVDSVGLGLGTDALSVAITNPAGGSAFANQDLYRRESANPDTSAIRIATGLASGATFVDRTPASGVGYEYQAVAFATNGTSAASAWTS